MILWIYPLLLRYFGKVVRFATHPVSCPFQQDLTYLIKCCKVIFSFSDKKYLDIDILIYTRFFLKKSTEFQARCLPTVIIHCLFFASFFRFPEKKGPAIVCVKANSMADRDALQLMRDKVLLNHTCVLHYINFLDLIPRTCAVLKSD